MFPYSYVKFLDDLWIPYFPFLLGGIAALLIGIIVLIRDRRNKTKNEPTVDKENYEP
jgi:TRAP-type C4-dicarboxylate transport system permease small subunit